MRTNSCILHKRKGGEIANWTREEGVKWEEGRGMEKPVEGLLSPKSPKTDTSKGERGDRARLCILERWYHEKCS